MVLINLPSFLKILILKKNKLINLFLYEKNYFFLLYIKENAQFFFNKESNSIKIKNNSHFENQNKINTFVKKFLKKINNYEFIKIKFKGKGYKISISKKKKIIVFFFGSINTKIFKINKTKIKKINKYKFILKSINSVILKNTSLFLKYIKKINPYTLRGIRVSRSKIIKKKGKKGVWV